MASGSSIDLNSGVLFDLFWFPLAQNSPPLDDRLQRFEPQSGPERFQGEHPVTFDIAEAHIVAKAPNQHGLLGLERRLPNQAVELVAHDFGNALQQFIRDIAILVIDTDAPARFTALDNDPASAPFDIPQSEVSERARVKLSSRILLADLGDSHQTSINRAADHIAP